MSNFDRLKGVYRRGEMLHQPVQHHTFAKLALVCTVKQLLAMSGVHYSSRLCHTVVHCQEWFGDSPQNAWHYCFTCTLQNLHINQEGCNPSWQPGNLSGSPAGHRT